MQNSASRCMNYDELDRFGNFLLDPILFFAFPKCNPIVISFSFSECWIDFAYVLRNPFFFLFFLERKLV